MNKLMYYRDQLGHCLFAIVLINGFGRVWPVKGCKNRNQMINFLIPVSVASATTRQFICPVPDKLVHKFHCNSGCNSVWLTIKLSLNSGFISRNNLNNTVQNLIPIQIILTGSWAHYIRWYSSHIYLFPPSHFKGYL